jgi:hypothetical protein
VPADASRPPTSAADLTPGRGRIFSSSDKASHVLKWIWILVVHQLMGYSTAFVVGPAALMPRKGGLERRRWGRPYVGGMIALYFTSTTRTLQFEWTSWYFARNFTFNLFGFMMVLVGWRAINLASRRNSVGFAPLDWTLTTTLLRAFGNNENSMARRSPENKGVSSGIQ